MRRVDKPENEPLSSYISATKKKKKKIEKIEGQVNLVRYVSDGFWPRF